MQFRISKQHDITSRHLLKKFQVTSNKRRVIGNSTLPYGWVDQSDVDMFAELMIDGIDIEDF